jgi:hypothetical protein
MGSSKERGARVRLEAGSLRAVKITVWAMLVVIILLAAVVVGKLGLQLFSAGPAKSPPPAVASTVSAAAPSALPSGSKITTIIPVGDRAVMLITLPGGGQELRSIDPRTGAAATLLTTSP